MRRQVIVRNNGMGWHVVHSTLGRESCKAGSERLVPWRGDCATTLVAFLAAEVRRLAPEVEVTGAPV